MDDLSIPVIRLEVSYMKHAILHAFSAHTLKVDASVKKAVEEFCTPENIETIVKRAVDTALNDAIKEEIRRFYEYGAGRAYIAEAVRERLELRNGK